MAGMSDKRSTIALLTAFLLLAIAGCGPSYYPPSKAVDNYHRLRVSGTGTGVTIDTFKAGTNEQSVAFGLHEVKIEYATGRLLLDDKQIAILKPQAEVTLKLEADSFTLLVDGETVVSQELEPHDIPGK